jgi:hypothetical protein
MGCNRYDASLSGQLLLDGQPLDRGTITFMPTTTGPTAYGQVNAEGLYTAETGNRPGLPSGDYQVIVAVVEKIPSKDIQNPPTYPAIIPLKYKDPARSGITCSVEKGKNEFNVELDSKATK